MTAVYNENDLREVERQRIAAIRDAIITELGAGWTAHRYDDPDNYDHMRRVDGPEGAALYIHGAGWAGKGRVSLSGDYPRRDGTYFQPREGRAAASYSADRDPKAIAKDAARRMVAPYLTQYAKALAEARAWDTSKSASAANGARMRRAFGDASDDTREPEGFYFNSDATYATGSCSEDRVSFKHLSCTIEQGIAIAAILKADR